MATPSDILSVIGLVAIMVLVRLCTLVLWAHVPAFSELCTDNTSSCSGSAALFCDASTVINQLSNHKLAR